jgi:two-component system nitrate/nitrite response regulator NarL
MIQLLIAHPDPIGLARMSEVLEGEADLAVVSTVTSADAAFEVVAKTPVDLLLASFALPADGALRLVQTLGGVDGAPKVLVTDMAAEPTTILYLIEEGAAGYVYGEEGLAGLVKKIRAIHSDEFMLCPEIAAALMVRIAELKQLAHELDGGALAQPTVAYAELTPREREVLHLIGREMSNHEIAETLVIELGTVKNHVHNLLRKLDVCNRKQAAQVARQLMGEAVPT